MHVNHLIDGLAVSPQIAPEDVAPLAEAGFTTLVDNRPDVEVGADLASNRMAALAAEAGLDFHYLPVSPGGLTPDTAARFRQILDAAPGPVLAYCRSGTRSAHLWALARAGQIPAERIIAAGAAAGYDLSGLVRALR